MKLPQAFETEIKVTAGDEIQIRQQNFDGESVVLLNPHQARVLSDWMAGHLRGDEFIEEDE
jgi:hypothetical protein